MEMGMDDRVYCKNCVSMPDKLANGEYKTWKARCKAGDPFWDPELKMRCPTFKEKKNVVVESNESFWD